MCALENNLGLESSIMNWTCPDCGKADPSFKTVSGLARVRDKPYCFAIHHEFVVWSHNFSSRPRKAQVFEDKKTSTQGKGYFCLCWFRQRWYNPSFSLSLSLFLCRCITAYIMTRLTPFFFLFLYLSQLSSGLHKMKEEIHRLWSHSEARKTSETGSAIWIFQRSASEWIHSSIFCFLFPSHFSFSYVCDLFRCVVVLKYNALRMGCVGPPPLHLRHPSCITIIFVFFFLDSELSNKAPIW